MTAVELLFSLIRSAVTGREATQEVIDSINNEVLEEIYEIAEIHDLAHVIAYALSKIKKLGNDEINKKFSRAMLLAVYRYEQKNYEYQRICTFFEEEKIKFIPLKGSVIRKYYPEEWLRNSCDIDILVEEERIEEIVALLTQKLNYKSNGKRRSHDISLFTPGNVHLELHFNIISGNSDFNKVLSRVWEFASPVEGKVAHYGVSDEFLYFHIISHAAYHFLRGGCGIRPIFDIWLLKKNLHLDKKKLLPLLKEADLVKFTAEIEHLSNVWAEGCTHNEITKMMEQYILSGGVYGTMENRIGMNEHAQSRLKYLFHRTFMPYATMKKYYKILDKAPVLYPFFHIVRWFRIMFKNNDSAFFELEQNQAISAEKVESLNKMKKMLHLR